MKKVIIIKIKRYKIDRNNKEKLIEERTVYQCPYCESNWTYKVKIKNQIYCRKCGQISNEM